MELPSAVQKLVEQYRLAEREREVKEGENVIAVDEVAARVASFYEKIRGVVDWREEHLLRKTAIERILKRRILVGKYSDDFAERFLQELVRGGHFPNKRIPLARIDEVQHIIDKYVYISDHSKSSQTGPLGKIQAWLWSIAASEIEEALSLPRRERGLIEFMYSELEARVQVEDRKGRRVPLSNDEKTLQMYVGVQKALFKLDQSTIAHHLLEKFFPDWRSPSQDTLSNVSQNLAQLHTKIRGIFEHPYSEKFYQLAEKYDTAYLILGDIISDDPEGASELLENHAELEEAIRSIYDQRLSRLQGRIGRAAFYSTLSVFLTKILLALLIEIPLDRYLTNELNYSSIGFNVAIPPLLMLLLVLSAKTSSEQNLHRVVVEVMKIIHPTESKEPYKLIPLRKKPGSLVAAVYGVYLLSFLISFGAIVWALQKFYFSIFSIGIFLVFISLILFAGTRIRQRARELMMEEEKAGFFYGIFDFFSLPMIQVGKWLSSQLIKYNVIVVALNFLIEIPFQVFVEFLEHWRTFLKEKKEEIH